VNYVFLDFEDQRLSLDRDAACDQVIDIIDQFKPDEIYLPHRRDRIIDHIETNRIVRRAVDRLSSPALLLEYPVWLWNGWPWTQGGLSGAHGKLRGALRAVRDVADIVFACRTRVDVRSVLHRKIAALAAYRSQTQRFNGDSRWPVLSDVADGEFVRCFETGIEVFRATNYGRDRLTRSAS
jgi:LmbE family N-acetylglucosaminyl deacetylase